MYYPNKKSSRFYATHIEDNYTDLGYDYRKNILRKTMSPVLFENDNNSSILERVEDMFDYLVDSVKQIRTMFMISLDKTDRNVN